MSQVIDARFHDLVEGEIRPSFRGVSGVGLAPNARLLAVGGVRAELDVFAEQVGRGGFEDRAISRMALASAVARLIEIDRDFYREVGP